MLWLYTSHLRQKEIKLNPYFIAKLIFFFIFFAVLHGLQELSSLTRDWTQILNSERVEF